MPTREEEFKQRLAAVLANLDANGKHDIEAMWLLGSLAATLTDTLEAKNWTALKRDITRENYDKLLGDFQAEGNRQHAAGNAKKAYAIQALAISLIARTQPDSEVAAGARLLDELIDYATFVYRKNPNAGTLGPN